MTSLERGEMSYKEEREIHTGVINHVCSGMETERENGYKNYYRIEWS